MKITRNELHTLVGKEGKKLMNGFYINVKILEVKHVYGKIIYTVSPLSGEGIGNVQDVKINGEFVDLI